MIKEKKIKLKIKNKKQLYSLNNKLFNVGDDIEIKPSDLPKGSHIEITAICENCKAEKKTQFNTYYRITKGLEDGYYCNNKECINIKRKLSINKKYNVDNVFQIDKIKEKIKETNLERYGVINPQQNKTIKRKTEETNITRYGTKNPFQSNLIKEKIKETNLERHGVEYPQQSAEIRSKYPSLHKPSKKESQFLVFIKENYKGEIKTNLMNIIKGYELDIYLPELGLAFEFNGLYWHSEIYKDNKYHKMKSDLCEEQEIQLIHIYEDIWKYKKDIIESMILNKLNRSSNKIYARKTEIREIKNNNLIRKFLNENHIQGFVGSSFKLGLFYDDELVSIMTFGKLRKFMGNKSEDGNYEMLRFCNKKNTNVIGGASKLFKYFMKVYTPNSVISYADRSYSNGNLYTQLKFNKINNTRPNYYYIINNKRHHRFNFRKDILVKEGFDINKSEHQIMLERKIYRIYDSGSIKFEYN